MLNIRDLSSPFIFLQLVKMPRAQASQSSKPTKTTSKAPYPSPATKHAKAVLWTDEMDKIMIKHIMSQSEVWIKFDWAKLIKEEFHGMNEKQVCVEAL